MDDCTPLPAARTVGRRLFLGLAPRDVDEVVAVGDGHRAHALHRRAVRLRPGLAERETETESL